MADSLLEAFGRNNFDSESEEVLARAGALFVAKFMHVVTKALTKE